MYITFYIVYHYHTYHTTLLNNSLIIPKVAKGLSIMASSFMHGNSCMHEQTNILHYRMQYNHLQATVNRAFKTTF